MKNQEQRVGKKKEMVGKNAIFKRKKLQTFIEEMDHNDVNDLRYMRRKFKRQHQQYKKLKKYILM